MDGVETYWIWLIVGLTLAMLEMVVPGVYLIWLAMAALTRSWTTTGRPSKSTRRRMPP